MNYPAHKTEGVNRTQTMRFHSIVFNGKEKDYESGFLYYGVRYYWSGVLTGRLSVDPMADKYPSVCPYNYGIWNPVKLVEPEGKEAMENEDWYRNDVGDIPWGDKVKRQEDLPGQQGAKGEKIMKGKRPKVYKGSWSPKNKLQ